MLRTLLPVGLCAALYSVCMAELRSQAPASQPPTFHADTHLVQVTVIATDSRMNPVIDLQVGDFRVFEDGQEQPISLFSADMRPTAVTAVEIQPAGVANVSNQVPTSGGVTMLLFDRLNTAWGDQAQARRNIINYLSQAPPTEKIGFYVLESSTVSIVHDFTSDTGSLLRALSRVQARRRARSTSRRGRRRRLDPAVRVPRQWMRSWMRRSNAWTP